MQVAPTDLTVLITGESGTGKEVFSKIIHQLSARKHGPYIAVNCGAIPEGTIDSELFGHEKGSFTGAQGERKGYFEVVNNGSIFLDEIAELPLGTQVRLLRVLETGEFIRVGSSKPIKTNVRVIAATNVNMEEAIDKGKFREDLYYRLHTVPVTIPPLRERKEDIHLLFRKFASDFAEKYRMPGIRLDDEARQILENYRWRGNVRQLKNIAEQISVIEETREVKAGTLKKYLTDFDQTTLPVLVGGGERNRVNDFSERDLLYKILFDMRKDMTEVKNMLYQFLKTQAPSSESIAHDEFLPILENKPIYAPEHNVHIHHKSQNDTEDTQHEIIEESLSLGDKELELIKKALEKHKGKRKSAAHELGISERTLYRKIKEFDIKE
jgi:transcriptional regulator with PAS, ATPase and Fis domain